MRPFRERNPLPLGITGLAVLAAMGVLAFNISAFTGGTEYSAAFSEAAGLKPGEEVRIAGVKVGKVKGVDLEDDHVKVTFTCSSWFGDRSRAEIKIRTILGAHLLALNPGGAVRQSPGQEIPVARTTAPYNVVPALQDASRQVGQIDTKQLATSFDVLAQTLQYSPENLRRSLAGLQRLSRAVSARDDELNQLLGHSRNVTKMLADRSGDLSQLITSGGLVLQELNARRVVINQLLVGTVNLSQQVTGAIQENQRRLGPALQNLHRVINVLERNQGNLEKAFETLGPFAATSADFTGTGRWVDIYVQNLILVPPSVAPPSGNGAPPTSQGPTLPFIK